MFSRFAQKMQCRHRIVGLAFLSILICYLDRINISVAIIPMADELGWNSGQQGLALSSFFIGYILTQIIGGRMADRYGAKLVLAIGVIAWSVATILTPIAALWGFGTFIAIRIIMGLGEGVSLPAVYSLYGRWLPLEERSSAIGLTYSAIPLGSVMALTITPFIVLAFGWEWAFYSFGALGLFWIFFWQYYATSLPSQNAYISKEEAALITSNLPSEEPAQEIPWRAILSNSGVWAIIIAHFCANWGTYVLMAWLPTYVNRALGVDFASVGLLSAVPYIISFIAFNYTGRLADRLIGAGYDTTLVRKGMQAIGFVGPAVVLMIVGHLMDTTQVIVLMAIANFFLAFSAGGYQVNHLDIAPRHAGLFMGISNTAGTIPGIIGVAITGYVLEWTGSWVIVFQMASGIYLVGLVSYLMLATGKRQFD